MRVSFTAAEIQFIEHRLGVPDALQEVLADGEDDAIAALAITPTAFDAAIHIVQCAIRRNFMPLELTPFEQAILRDCIEGSTYVACFDDIDPTSTHPKDVAQRKAQTACLRAARSAVRKLRKAGFETGDAPAM